MDKEGPVPGASVDLQEVLTESATPIKAITDGVGGFEVKVVPGTYAMVISKNGYATHTDLITLSDRQELSKVIKINKLTRAERLKDTVQLFRSIQSVLKSNTPIDIIYPEEIAATSQYNLGQLLHYYLTSAYSVPTTQAAGSDHVDPFSIRGLDSDQILLLVNGKRRHTNAYCHSSSTIARGTMGNDINNIPLAAIERIEILRDGASVLYGSDAVAGVINIVLKENASGGIFSSQTGANIANGGIATRTSINYGAPLVKEGKITATLELITRENPDFAGQYTGAIYGDTRDQNPAEVQKVYDNIGLGDGQVMRTGGGSIRQAAAGVVSLSMPLTPKTEVYANADASQRISNSPSYYRLPKDSLSSNPDLFPLGYQPYVLGTYANRYYTMGLRNQTGNWTFDMFHTGGENQVSYGANNTINPSLGEYSPTRFALGGITYGSKLFGFDGSYSNVLEIGGEFAPFSLIFGALSRRESYRIEAGETAAWTNGGETTPNGTPKNAFVEGFPGFSPENAIYRTRLNTAVYAGFDIAPIKALQFTGNVRYEVFESDTTLRNLSWKLAGRYSFKDYFTVRATYSTGFRAPSMSQLYFSDYQTEYVNGTYETQGLIRNIDEVSRDYGLLYVRPELVFDFGAGITATPFKNVIINLDYFNIYNTERVLQSNIFRPDNAIAGPVLAEHGLTNAMFIINAFNTTTNGFDATVSYSISREKTEWEFSAGYGTWITTINEYRLPSYFANQADQAAAQEAFYDREQQARALFAQPADKLILNAMYQYKKFTLRAQTVRFGWVEYKGSNPDGSRDQRFDPRWVTNVSSSYRAGKRITLSIGCNNLLNVFPEQLRPELSEEGRFLYSRNVNQFQAFGAHVFGKLELNL